MPAAELYLCSSTVHEMQRQDGHISSRELGESRTATGDRRSCMADWKDRFVDQVPWQGLATLATVPDRLR